jgi:lipoprotein-anchoring transpeptidase ErfK/SrfK
MTSTPKSAGSNGSRLIRVHLTRQIVEVVEGSTLKFQFDCVTGDASHPTNRGQFRILRKPRDYRYRSHTYKVQMNYPLFFTADGKALHQYHGILPLTAVRIARNNVSDWFGSHGCVRLDEPDARALFEWATIGRAVHVI